jgi:tetratricopeptide (TPR) repeat protein
MASVSGTNLSKMEAVLKEARAVMDQNPPNQAKLHQTIAVLENYQAQFPEEIRFPLFLAEANYRLADPSGDVAKEFVHYEKTEFYAQKAMALDPNRTEAHYWHGLYLLKKAQKVGGIRAFFIVKNGIAELEKVRQDMPAYDHAGASRVLGLLYCLAPGWTPFGNLDKSIALGKEATHLAPDYMLNRLYLGNAYKKRGDKADAIREYQAILEAAANGPGDKAVNFSEQARTKLRELGIPG